MAAQNNLTLTGLQPLPYGDIPAQLYLEKIDPIRANYSTIPYKNFQIGTFWLNTVSQNLWYLANLTLPPHIEGNWIQIGGPGGGTVTSITAGNGITLTPSPINSVGSVSLTIPVIVSYGGTGNLTFNPNQVIVSGTTATGPFQQIAPSTAGFVLTSNAGGAAPTFQAIPAGVAGITTLNTIGPAVGGNFSVTSLGGSVTITPGTNSIDLAVTNPASTAATNNFFAYLANAVPGFSGGTVPFDTLLYSTFPVGGGFVGNTFTAGRTGYYIFTCTVSINTFSSNTVNEWTIYFTTTGSLANIYFGTNQNPYAMAAIQGGVLSLVTNQTLPIRMVAGDTLVVTAVESVGTVNIVSTSSGGMRTWLSGYQIA